MDNRNFLVKATTSLSNNKQYTIWFTIGQKSTGRVRISYLEESPIHSIQGYMLLHMISQSLEILQVPLPKGLTDATWHIKKHKNQDRFLEVKGTWYRIDGKVQGYWLNNSGLLAMVKYIRDISEPEVRDMVYLKDKRLYQILNPAHIPEWTISFHTLA